MVESLELGEVPFYWRVKKTAIQPPHDIPTRLPFAFSFMDDLQLIIQKRNPEVLQWLEHVYTEDANVGYLQEGHALAESYGGEFIEFFRRASGALSKRPTTAADIGCGGIYLLQQLKKTGLKVKGIDPSPVTVEAGRRADIEIIQSFYPTMALTEKFDVLMHYDVLEHIDDPVSFLQAHKVNLSEGGGLIFAVPDCTHHIELGDVSMVLHEHLNYFDKASLSNTVRAAGFEPVMLEAAQHGGVLMCCAVVADVALSRHEAVSRSWEKFEKFSKQARTSLQRFASCVDQSQGMDLGLYVPLRAFPYLSQVPSDVRLRFFDDDPGLLGRYFDGFDIAIENRLTLESQPPKSLIVCSLAFGQSILQRLPESITRNIQITRWKDLFS